MAKKNRKTLYLPDWVEELLDREGAKYDGPGVVASASIYAFCNLSKKGKIETLKAFRQSEISRAYEEKKPDDLADLAVEVTKDALRWKKSHQKKNSRGKTA